jgi:hypothetical protein
MVSSTLGHTNGDAIRAQEGAMAVKVFVSSTYVDLKDHRLRVIAQLRKAGYHVDPMEDWTSDADEPTRFSLNRLDGCQACVLLVGFRRGFVPAGEARSITQMEYDHALDRQIDVLPFLLEDGVTGWPDQYDDRPKDPQVNMWREYLGLHHGIERFTADPVSVEVLRRYRAGARGSTNGSRCGTTWPPSGPPTGRSGSSACRRCRTTRTRGLTGCSSSHR